MPILNDSQLERIRTDDGSETLNRKDLGATYRSAGGACGESRHVFIEASGLEKQPGPWRVLELGFGLGTNLDQLARAAASYGVQAKYVGLEAEPIPGTWVPEDLIHRQFIQELLNETSSQAGDVRACLEHVTATLVPTRWQESSLPPFGAHAIFHDPFGPVTNPDCWGLEVFLWEKKHIAPDGIICTYSAAGHVRRAMRDAGFYVAEAPGYGRKREMTLASLTEERLAPHKIRYRP